MKKIFKTFLLLSIVVLSSCSGNDENTNPEISAKNEIKMTINGKEVVFNKVVVGENDYHFYQEYGGALKLTGTIDNATGEVISISIFKNKVGTDSLAEVLYTLNGEEYLYSPVVPAWDCKGEPSKIVLVTTKNDGKTISGNFSGKLTKCKYTNGNEELVGTFNITESSFVFNY